MGINDKGSKAKDIHTGEVFIMTRDTGSWHSHYSFSIKSTLNSKDCFANSSGKGGNGFDERIARTAAC
jgi:hypothetical protein